jgi:regulatory protein
LKQKRIPEKLISSVFSEIDKISYKKNLEEILKSKLKTEKEPDKIKLKQKLFRFAASRGFESDLIMQIINKIVSEN